MLRALGGVEVHAEAERSAPSERGLKLILV